MLVLNNNASYFDHL